MKKILTLIFFVILAGCDKYHLSVFQQTVDVNYLASTHVGTPDPRQANPPYGQMLSMSWHVPIKILKEEPHIRLHVIYWDYTEEVKTFPIKYLIGYDSFFVLNDDFERTKGILTYKAEIVTGSGKVYKQMKHQLWVNLIRIDDGDQTKEQEEPKTESAQPISS